jgi:hypothetical protein
MEFSEAPATTCVQLVAEHCKTATSRKCKVTAEGDQVTCGPIIISICHK